MQKVKKTQNIYTWIHTSNIYKLSFHSCPDVISFSISCAGPHGLWLSTWPHKVFAAWWIAGPEICCPKSQRHSSPSFTGGSASSWVPAHYCPGFCGRRVSSARFRGWRHCHQWRSPPLGARGRLVILPEGCQWSVVLFLSFCLISLYRKIWLSELDPPVALSNQRNL